ncbi:Fe-S cluster biogenesis protein NfuA, 4Fe-4S-binding domain [Eubacterium aggregans]|uniref:Fe-S cluster biogenesis protein NfuA, 4Fe-4S-binding domain n=1 Tax=Eubacterium aggregans TaxID=81409 RepID=A0A1H3WTS8_9FIRM|nr:NifU family protein [Eubacterium aggregans]SDZ90533.1 Fe-S cluster biogenesis protein NfuA, 4Fe-4S-binding domain [Eubacterium aggregans]
MESRIQAVITEYIKPLLGSHGGAMEVVNLEDGVLRFRLTGQCAGCPAADLTSENLIKTELMERVPELKDVVLIQSISSGLLDEARRILEQRHGG